MDKVNVYLHAGDPGCPWYITVRQPRSRLVIFPFTSPSHEREAYSIIYKHIAISSVTMEPKTDDHAASHHDDQPHKAGKSFEDAEIPGASNGSSDLLKRQLGNRQVRPTLFLSKVLPIETKKLHAPRGPEADNAPYP